MMRTGQRLTCSRSLHQRDLDAFATISGDENPIHLDPVFAARTRFGEPIAHGMLLYGLIGRCLGQLSPGRGVIQSWQQLKFTRPAFASEEIAIELEVEDTPAAGVARINTSITKAEGVDVCLGSSLVWTDGAEEFHTVTFNPPVYEKRNRVHRGLALGRTASQTRQFTRAELDRYHSLVDEVNPIHSDRSYARRLGFDDVLLPGGLLGGLISSILGTQLPGLGTIWLGQSLHFLEPAYPDREVTTTVEITQLQPEKNFVNLRTTITGPQEALLVDGEALVLVSDLMESP